MILSNFEQVEAKENFVLMNSALVAMTFSFFIGLNAIFYMHHSLHPTAAVSDAPVLEAELVQAPPTPHLYEKKVTAVPVAKSEATISKDLSKGRESKTALKEVLDNQNQTTNQAPPPVATHGPVVSYAPSPQLPSYLKDQNLKTSVLIEFFVSAAGVAKPSLIGSSGNEELDALALTTAKQWIFQPAFHDGKAIESKVRLRINFDVQ